MRSLNEHIELVNEFFGKNMKLPSTKNTPPLIGKGDALAAMSIQLGGAVLLGILGNKVIRGVKNWVDNSIVGNKVDVDKETLLKITNNLYKEGMAKANNKRSKAVLNQWKKDITKHINNGDISTMKDFLRVNGELGNVINRGISSFSANESIDTQSLLSEKVIGFQPNLKGSLALQTLLTMVGVMFGAALHRVYKEYSRKYGSSTSLDKDVLKKAITDMTKASLKNAKTKYAKHVISSWEKNLHKRVDSGEIRSLGDLDTIAKLDAKNII